MATVLEPIDDVAKHGSHDQSTHGRKGSGSGASIPKGTALYHTAYDHRNDAHEERGVMHASGNGESGGGVYLTDNKSQAADRRSWDDNKSTLIVEPTRDLKMYDRDTVSDDEYRADVADGVVGTYDGVVWNGFRGQEREVVVFDPEDLSIVGRINKDNNKP
jgi:hypothetical protein